MGMVHCYRCSLPGHYAVFEKPLFTLLINRNTYIFIRQGITRSARHERPRYGHS